MWLLFAFLSAVFAAVGRTCIKSAAEVAGDPAVVFARFALAAPLAWLLLAIMGIPTIGPDFWYSVLVACLFDLPAIIFMTKSLRSSSIAMSVPLLSFSPAFLLGIGFFMLGETPTAVGIAGVMTIVLGAYLLRLPGRGGSWLAPFILLSTDKGARYMLATAVLFAFAGVYFKRAIVSSSPFFSLAISLSVNATAYALLHTLRRKSVRELLPNRTSVKRLITLGVAVFLVALCANIAFSTGLTSYVVAIKRLSILFNIILGAIVFKEPGLRRNLSSAGIMVVGAALVVLG